MPVKRGGRSVVTVRNLCRELSENETKSNPKTPEH